MPETTEPQLTEAQLIANAVDNSMRICLRNSADQSKPEGFRVMMEHFAEAGRQILEMIQTRRYIDGEPFKCEGCEQPTAMVHFTGDDVGLCRLCFAAVPPTNDERCPHCHWKPSPDHRPQSGVYKCENCNYPFAQRRKDSTRLTEAEAAEIADAFPYSDYDPDTAEMPVCETCDGAIDDHKAGCVVPTIHALIRDRRAMKVENEQLRQHVRDLNHDFESANKHCEEHHEERPF